MRKTSLGTVLLVGGSLVLAGVAGAPPHARAGGLYAGESGAAAQTRGGAFVARADDPTALMHNPAGLAKTGKYSLYVGANTVLFHQSFTRAGAWSNWTQAGAGEPAFAGQPYPEMENNGPPQPIPLIAFAARITGQLTLGVGVIAPQGYPNRDFDRTITVAGVETAATPTRYDVIKQESLAALPSLAVAYRVMPKLDVGLRLSWGFGTLSAESYTWGIVNNEEDVEQDGLFTVDVSDSFIPAFGFGVLYRATDNLELGLAYNSAVKMNAKGTGTADLGSRLSIGDPPIPTVIIPVNDDFARCEPGGTRESLKACINLTLPMTAALGARWIFLDGAGREKGDVELNFRWENWSAAKDIEVIVDGQSAQDHPTMGLIPVRDLEIAYLRHGFEDVFVLRLGGQWAVSDAFTVRGGLSFDTAAAPVSWTRLDIDGTERYQGAAGVAYTTGKLRFDLGGAVIFSPSRTVEQVAIADEANNNQHVQPNPVQPLEGPLNQRYDPINNGEYSSGYYVIAAGVTANW